MNYGSSATYSGAPSAWARMVSGVRHRAAGAHRQSSWVTPGPRLALSGRGFPPPPPAAPCKMYRSGLVAAPLGFRSTILFCFLRAHA